MDILEEAAAYAASLFAGDSSGHDLAHTLRVSRLAARIAREEGADEEVCTLAALLHDVDDRKLFPGTAEDHGHARAFLRSRGVGAAQEERIIHIIVQVPFSAGVTPDTPEGCAVQDADRLDAIGAVGIARTFAYGGSRGRALYEPDDAPGLTEEARRRGRDACTIRHFYDKLLLLKDRLNTRSARAVAEERHRFMEAFLEEFYAEWDGRR